MRKADQITGIVMLVFSIAVAYASWQMPQRVEFGPGMGFLPFWLAVLMGVLSLSLLIEASARKAAAGGNPFPGRRALINVALVLAGLLVYIAVLDKLGFAVSTVLFIAFLVGAVQKEKWIKTSVVALLSTGGLYIVFHVLLEVNLPRNIFGF